MTEMQRMKNDSATMDKRETADKAMKDSRDRNDELTADRRSKADKTLEMNRFRNDEMTADRRETKDGFSGMPLAIFLLILAGLVAGIFFIFF